MKEVQPMDDYQDGLRRIWVQLENEKGTNKVHRVSIDLAKPSKNILAQDGPDLLWQILSHPHSKIFQVVLRGSISHLRGSPFLSVLRRWCKEIPAIHGPRMMELELLQSRDPKSFEALEDLRKVLTQNAVGLPQNGVQGLILNDPFYSPPIPMCEILLRPVISDPNNELRTLDLGNMQCLYDKELEALRQGLASPNCKVTDLFLPKMGNVGFGNVLALLDDLARKSCLEALRLYGMEVDTMHENVTVMKCIVSLLKRPGNKIRCLDFTAHFLSGLSFAVLAEALRDENCQLEKLYFMLASVQPSSEAVHALAMAIRHPHNKLKVLEVDGISCDDAGFAAFGESLKHSACKLETFALGDRQYGDAHGAGAIAEALETSTSNRLTRLSLFAPQPASFYRAMAKSLRSRNNRLKTLDVAGLFPLDPALQLEFCHALRLSNVTHFEGDSQLSFFISFNKPFVQVLYALLSIRHVPRLGRSAWVRLLPMHDLILGIAERLGWKLHMLRLA